jgi:HK97 family phage major capsid protein
MQMPANTILFGAFSQVLLGEWGTLEIRTNPYGTNANAGNVEIYSFQTVDVGVRHPAAFSKCSNFAMA